jgi:hypothetical protein
VLLVWEEKTWGGERENEKKGELTPCLKSFACIHNTMVCYEY